MTVAEAVEALGGPRRAALLVDVTRQTVHNWLAAGRIHQAMHCLAVAEILLARGHAVSLWELAGYRPVTVTESTSATG